VGRALRPGAKGGGRNINLSKKGSIREHPKFPHDKKFHTRWKFQLKRSSAKQKTLGDRNPLHMVFSPSEPLLERFMFLSPLGEGFSQLLGSPTDFLTFWYDGWAEIIPFQYPPILLRHRT
jgi:hypothetical protein